MYSPVIPPENIGENGDEEEHRPDLQPFRDAKAQPINKQQRHHNRKTKQRQRN